MHKVRIYTFSGVLQAIAGLLLLNFGILFHAYDQWKQVAGFPTLPLAIFLAALSFYLISKEAVFKEFSLGENHKHRSMIRTLNVLIVVCIFLFITSLFLVFIIDVIYKDKAFAFILNIFLMSIFTLSTIISLFLEIWRGKMFQSSEKMFV
ncbi:hypothetical protein [Asticcacaulis sp. YBE204]|uniref:hypothetical protein n=1 Tax=Asticcacaulis sp. YBE204 TaxID=1282363 RepID=UPI0003C3D45F|nr:hypothetical protein [Asticcacaulis sp. YBE204]ESQ80901.1 hypothetical protein AEYBE204_00850 [Asticcacaulis sp. YBE204]